MKFLDQLERSGHQNQSMLCVGLGPRAQPFSFEVAGRLESYILISVLKSSTPPADLVMAYKPQIAYFSSHKAESQLEKLMDRIREVAPSCANCLGCQKRHADPLQNNTPSRPLSVMGQTP
jgi:orotidine-5'-phosphate decarboxylase